MISTMWATRDKNHCFNDCICLWFKQPKYDEKEKIFTSEERAIVIEKTIFKKLTGINIKKRENHKVTIQIDIEG